MVRNVEQLLAQKKSFMTGTRRQNTESQALPALAFLHGFSGDRQPMVEVGEAFATYSRLYVDLPGHGGSAAISVDGFDDVTDLLRKTLVSYNILDFWLVVLVGGTAAMMAACQGLTGLCGVIVEGGHPGWNAQQRANVSVPIANGRSVFAQHR